MTREDYIIKEKYLAEAADVAGGGCAAPHGSEEHGGFIMKINRDTGKHALHPLCDFITRSGFECGHKATHLWTMMGKTHPLCFIHAQQVGPVGSFEELPQNVKLSHEEGGKEQQ